MAGEVTPDKHRGLKPAWEPGQSGNPAGRPKGARSKLGEAFLIDLLDDWGKHGVQAIEDMRAKNPGDYVKVVASILPKELEANEETINILSELLGRIDGRTRAIVPAQPALVTH